MKSRTHYEVLNVPPSISFAELHIRYKEQLVQVHPDRVSPAQSRKHSEHPQSEYRAKCTVCVCILRFQELTEAYSVLKDPTRRSDYNAALELMGRICKSCKGSGRTIINRGFHSGASHAKPCKACGGTGAK